MGYYSEVGILINTKDEKLLYDKVDELTRHVSSGHYYPNILEKADEKFQNAELTYYYFSWLRWYGVDVTCLEMALQQSEIPYQLQRVGEEIGDIDESENESYRFPASIYTTQGIDDEDLRAYFRKPHGYTLQFDDRLQVSRFIEKMENKYDIILPLYHRWEDVYLSNIEEGKVMEEIEKLVKNPSYAYNTYNSVYSKRVIDAVVGKQTVGIFEITDEDKLAGILDSYNKHRYADKDSDVKLDY